MQRFPARGVRRLAVATATSSVLAAAALVGTAAPSAAVGPTDISAVASVSVNEGDSGDLTRVFLRVTRTGDTSGTSTVKIATADGTATAPSDYAAKAPTLVRFDPGETVESVATNVKGDPVVEPDETFSFHLSSPVGATIGDGTGEITVVTDDTDAAPAFSINDGSFLEGDAGNPTVHFVIARSGSTTSSASVRFSTANGTATAPSDFQPKSAISVFFAVGQTTRTVTVNLKGDLVPEPDETFTVRLFAPLRASIADGSATGTIRNDDSTEPTSVFLPTFQVLAEGDAAFRFVRFNMFRRGNLEGTTRVDFATSDGTAVAPEDYVARTGTVTFRPGSEQESFLVILKSDRVSEPDETFTITLSSPGAVISDDTDVITIVNDD